jgi:hypothetical protein
VHQRFRCNLAALDLHHQVGATSKNLGLGSKFGKGGENFLNVTTSPKLHLIYLVSSGSCRQLGASNVGAN